jgi:Kef-type K+ transport system membrane component KefB
MLWGVMELSLLNLILVLVAAWLGGNLATRLGYPSVLGELIAGILLGPPLLGLLEPNAATSVLAQVGVLLMMLYVGLEINVKDVQKASWPGFLAAIGGFIVPAIMGYALSHAFGFDFIASLFIGMAMGVTALIVKSRILLELNILDTRISHVMMVGSLITDTLCLIIFAGILSLSEAGSLNVSEIALIVLKVVVFFVVTWFVGLRIVPRLYEWLHARGLDGRTFNATLILLIAFLYAEAAELVGLHGVIGTFLAGLYLREAISVRKLSHELTDLVKDVSLGFLAPIYFVTVGFQVSFSVFQNDLLLLILLVVAAVLGKVIGTVLFYWPSGYGWREGLVIGAGMNGRGVVEIIIANIGLQAGIITQEVFSILVFMAIFTTAMTPTTLQWGIDWLKRRGELVRSSGREGVVIVGAGPVARVLAKELSSTTHVTLIDANETNCQAAEALGLTVVRGNALNNEVLQDAKIDDAGTIITLTPNSQVNVMIAQRAREHFFVPDLRVHLTEKENKDLLEIMNEISAKPLFATPVDILEWDEKLLANEVQTLSQTIEKQGDEKSLENSLVLPLLVVRGQVRRLFNSQDLEPGDRVLTLSRSV